MGSLVRLAAAIYLTLHGVPVSGDVDVKNLAALALYSVLVQLRLMR